MNNYSSLDISPDFTVEDIHKIRVYNSERRKNMTVAEINADIKNNTADFMKYIEERRKAKLNVH